VDSAADRPPQGQLVIRNASASSLGATSTVATCESLVLDGEGAGTAVPEAVPEGESPQGPVASGETPCRTGRSPALEEGRREAQHSAAAPGSADDPHAVGPQLDAGAAPRSVSDKLRPRMGTTSITSTLSSTGSPSTRADDSSLTPDSPDSSVVPALLTSASDDSTQTCAPRRDSRPLEAGQTRWYVRSCSEEAADSSVQPAVETCASGDSTQTCAPRHDSGPLWADRTCCYVRSCSEEAAESQRKPRHSIAPLTLRKDKSASLEARLCDCAEELDRLKEARLRATQASGDPTAAGPPGGPGEAERPTCQAAAIAESAHALSRRLEALIGDALQCSCDRNVPGAMEVFKEATASMEVVAEVLNDVELLNMRNSCNNVEPGVSAQAAKNGQSVGRQAQQAGGRASCWNGISCWGR